MAVGFACASAPAAAAGLGLARIPQAAAASAPVAVSDAYTIQVGQTLSVGAPGVLANDTDVPPGAIAKLVGGTFSRGVGTLSPNGALTYAPSTNVPGTDVIAYCVADAGGTCLSPNGFITVTVAVPFSDVGIAMSGPASTPANVDIAYTMTLHNAGPLDATNLIMTDSLTGLSTFRSLTIPPGWSCEPRAVGDIVGAFTCQSDPATTLPVGQSVSFTLTVHVAANSVGITNQAAQTHTPTDPVSSNDFTQISTSIEPSSADLAVTLTAPGTVAANGTITYTALVVNNGPDAATGTSFTDNLDAQTTFVSLTVAPGWTCPTVPAVGGHGGATCSYPGGFAAGASSTFTIVAKVEGTAAGTLTNNAFVSSANPPDPNSANNTVAARTTVTATVPADPPHPPGTAPPGTTPPGSAPADPQPSPADPSAVAATELANTGLELTLPAAGAGLFAFVGGLILTGLARRSTREQRVPR
ncbi:Ig-like domain-containing protein [Leifsonia poae]|uniref:Ig-like domain-containing protein n=1 Tax=Leifsonia poae TaxID=110933 RepID=UPI001CBB85F9|nr:Ig-like domain-containing protein [Leifsonia poae]